jgi:hypothetical protein
VTACVGLRVIRFLAMYLLDPNKLEDIIAKLNNLSTKFIQEKTFYSVAAILYMHQQNLKEALRTLNNAPHASIEAYVQLASCRVEALVIVNEDHL